MDSRTKAGLRTKGDTRRREQAVASHLATRPVHHEWNTEKNHRCKRRENQAGDNFFCKKLHGLKLHGLKRVS